MFMEILQKQLINLNLFVFCIILLRLLFRYVREFVCVGGVSAYSMSSFIYFVILYLLLGQIEECSEKKY